MTRTAWWLLALAIGCGGDKDGSATGDDDDTAGDDDDTEPTPCSPLEPNDLPAVDTLQQSDDRFCEDAPLYDPDVPTASIQWFSEITIDGCGALSGYEEARIFPNATFEGQGVAECRVVWAITGVADDPLLGGTDVGLAIAAQLDVVETDCDPNPFEDFVAYDEHYNVSVAGGTTRWFFDSGTEFAAGFGNGSHLSFHYDECKLF